MKIKGIIEEDLINYKKPCMTIEMPFCNFKCDKECGEQVCQNGALATAPIIDVNPEDLILRYINNPITQAICFQGLEPFYPQGSYEELKNFIMWFRYQFHCMDDIVIYTGYNKDEISNYLAYLRPYRNIIIKFGRFIPNQKSHYDEVLGVNLASDNQYAQRIS